METLYSSIRDDLYAKIVDGTYPEGETIPSEMDLAKQYGVSRPTIRQALQILVNEGYLEKRRRRGTIVRKVEETQDEPILPSPRPATTGVQSFEEELSSSGKMIKTVPILVKTEEASAGIARALEISPGDPVHKLVRLRYVDDSPNVFMENYVPAALYPDFIDTDFSKVGLYQRMSQLGRPVHKVTRRIEVIKADAAISTLLDVPIGDPLFHFHTFGRDSEGTMVEYSVSTYRGRSNAFEFTVENPTSFTGPQEPLPEGK